MLFWGYSLFVFSCMLKLSYGRSIFFLLFHRLLCLQFVNRQDDRLITAKCHDASQKIREKSFLFHDVPWFLNKHGDNHFRCQPVRWLSHCPDVFTTSTQGLKINWPWFSCLRSRYLHGVFSINSVHHDSLRVRCVLFLLGQNQ